MKRFVALLAIISIVGAAAHACSICGGDFRNRPTLRQDAGSARVVVFGKLANPKLDPDPLSGAGTTELKIEQVLKGGDRVAIGQSLRIPRYYPADPKGPTHALVFFDVRGDKLEFAGIRATNGNAIAAYLGELTRLPAGNIPRLLDYCHRQLDHADPDVAADAFLELTRASDADVGRAAKSFEPERLRKLLTNPKAPIERIGFLGFLLGCCGNEHDADLLLRLMKAHEKEHASSLRGLMAGYIGLKPKDGWKRALDILADPHRGFLQRHAILGTVEFFWNWKPNEHRDALLLAMKAGVFESDLADIAIEDLRRWGCWDLTKDVLSMFGRKSHESEIIRRAILRYALTCPRPEAARFAAEQKKRIPDVVAEVEEALRDEKSMK
jgi:hypothetical protein